MRILTTLMLSLMLTGMLSAQELQSLPPPVVEESFLPRWYVDFDFAVVQPRLRGDTLDGMPNFSQKLDWTVATRFEVGFLNRGLNGWNAYFGYQGIYSDAGQSTYDPNSDTFFNFGQCAEINAFDFGVLSEPFCFLSVIRAQWDLSIRLTVAEFNQRYGMDFFVNQPSFIVARLRQQFVGAGPRAGLRMELPISDTGLALTGRVDGGLQWGSFQNRVQVESLIDNDFNADEEASSKGGVLWHAGAQLALRYAPPRYCDRLCFSAGYLYETWFSKDLNFMETSHFGRFDYHGPFFRMEWRY